MAFSQADVDALKESIAASGNAQEVRYADGAGVKYLSANDALALLGRMEQDARLAAADAAAALGVPVARRAFRASFSSGY